MNNQSAVFEKYPSLQKAYYLMRKNANSKPKHIYMFTVMYYHKQTGYEIVKGFISREKAFSYIKDMLEFIDYYRIYEDKEGC